MFQSALVQNSQRRKSVNIVVLFDADQDQQEQLFELMSASSMSEWFDNLGLDIREDCSVSEEDIDEFGWEDVINNEYDMCFISHTEGSPDWDYLWSGSELNCEEHNLCAFCVAGIEDFEYLSEFENFVYSAWQEAFERCGITDFAIICQEKDFARCGDGGVLSIDAKCRGSYTGKHFISMASARNNNIFNTEFDCEYLMATPSDNISVDEVQGGSAIMSVDYAKKFWCKLTGEDITKVEQLDLEDFINVVNFYDYYAIADRIPEGFLREDIPEEDDYEQFGNLLVCVASDTQYSAFDMNTLKEMEQERCDGKNFSINKLLKK